MNYQTLIVLMILANYRLTRLVVKDDFPPVLWIRDRLAGGWRPLTSKEQAMKSRPSVWILGEEDGETYRYIKRVKWSPFWLADLISCPWCASGWLAMGVVLVTDITVGVAAPVLAYGAVWALSALLASQDWA